MPLYNDPFSDENAYGLRNGIVDSYVDSYNRKVDASVKNEAYAHNKKEVVMQQINNSQIELSINSLTNHLSLFDFGPNKIMPVEKSEKEVDNLLSAIKKYQPVDWISGVVKDTYTAILRAERGSQCFFIYAKKDDKGNNTEFVYDKGNFIVVSPLKQIRGITGLKLEDNKWGYCLGTAPGGLTGGYILNNILNSKTLGIETFSWTGKNNVEHCARSSNLLDYGFYGVVSLKYSVMRDYLKKIQDASRGTALLFVESEKERLITASSFRKHSFKTALGCLHSITISDLNKCYGDVLRHVASRVTPCESDLYHDRIVLGSLYYHHNHGNGNEIIALLNSNKKIPVSSSIQGNASSYNLSRIKHASPALKRDYTQYV